MEEVNNVIIGHTGYIGSLLSYKLSQRDNGLTLGISRNTISSGIQSKNLNLFEFSCDIFKNEIDLKNIQLKNPIVYLNAHNFQPNFLNKKESLSKIYLSNIDCYKILIKNLKKLSPQKIIFLSSSGSLYGNTNKNNPSNENSILNPVSNYGMSKFILENLLNNFTKECFIPLTICRVSTIYGNSPSKKKFGFINHLISCAQTNKVPFIYGENTYRDYLHLEDLVEIIINISDMDLKDEIYNISSGCSYSCLQIYEIVKQNLKIYGNKLRNYEDKGLRLGENDKIFISSMKLRNEIKWIPKFNIEEGIKKIIMEIN